jgi:hypothetical protein
MPTPLPLRPPARRVTAPAVSATEHRLILDRVRRGEPAAAITNALARAGFARSVWCVYRTISRLRRQGLVGLGRSHQWTDQELRAIRRAALEGLAPLRKTLSTLGQRPTVATVLASPAPRAQAALPAARRLPARRWAGCPGKTAREAEIARRLAEAAQGLPRTGLALTLPGYRLDHAVGVLAPLVEEIVAVEHDPAIYRWLLSQPLPRHPANDRLRLVLGDFWATAALPGAPIRVLDYDGMAAMRPDLLDSLRHTRRRLAPRAVVRLTFETGGGLGADAVLATLSEHLHLESVWVYHHRHVRPMTTLVLRVRQLAGEPPPDAGATAHRPDDA